MSATINDIADAVVQALNQASYSLDVEAERSYQPRHKLESLDDLKVTVVPRGLAIAALDRSHDSHDYLIDVAVQQRVTPTTVEMDSLMGLVEEIADTFRGQRLAGYTPGSRCVAVVNEPIYAPDHLAEHKVFTSVLTLTFRVQRGR